MTGGIGAIVVKLLAERGIKVAVLDVQPLTCEGEFEFNISKLYIYIYVYMYYTSKLDDWRHGQHAYSSKTGLAG